VIVRARVHVDAVDAGYMLMLVDCIHHDAAEEDVAPERMLIYILMLRTSLLQQLCCNRQCLDTKI
jgi:hypothetical protein